MKYSLVITCFLALSVTTRASGLDGSVYAPGYASPDYYAYPSYAFEYAVRDPHTGDNKAQWERRDGDLVTGAYSLVEPDGSIRVVEYKADDKTGFHANVKRIAPVVHPVEIPIYKAPIPVLGHAPTTPIAVGPIDKLPRLVGAPLYTKPYYGHGAYSSVSVYKSDTAKIPAPLVPAPIYDAPALIHKEPAHIIPTPLPVLRSLPLPHPVPSVYPRPRIPIPVPRPVWPVPYSAPVELPRPHIPIHEPIPALPLPRPVPFGIPRTHIPIHEPRPALPLPRPVPFGIPRTHIPIHEPRPALPLPRPVPVGVPRTLNPIREHSPALNDYFTPSYNGYGSVPHKYSPIHSDYYSDSYPSPLGYGH